MSIEKLLLSNVGKYVTIKEYNGYRGRRKLIKVHERYLVSFLFAGANHADYMNTDNPIQAVYWNLYDSLLQSKKMHVGCNKYKIVEMLRELRTLMRSQKIPKTH